MTTQKILSQHDSQRQFVMDSLRHGVCTSSQALEACIKIMAETLEKLQKNMGEMEAFTLLMKLEDEEQFTKEHFDTRENV